MNTSSQNFYIYQDLKNQIIMMELLPGQSSNESETADKYSISRTPMREIFRKLENDGLVEIRPKKGTYISLIHLSDIIDIIYIREKLELCVIYDLIGNIIMPNQLDMLRINIKKQEQLFLGESTQLDISKQYLYLDNEFHKLLFSFVNKENVWNKISLDSPHYNRLRILSNIDCGANYQDLIGDHKDIVDAIIDKNFNRVTEIYKNHLYNAIKNQNRITTKFREYFSL